MSGQSKSGSQKKPVLKAKDHMKMVRVLKTALKQGEKIHIVPAAASDFSLSTKAGSTIEAIDKMMAYFAVGNGFSSKNEGHLRELKALIQDIVFHIEKLKESDVNEVEFEAVREKLVAMVGVIESTYAYIPELKREEQVDQCFRVARPGGKINAQYFLDGIIVNFFIAMEKKFNSKLEQSRVVVPRALAQPKGPTLEEYRCTETQAKSLMVALEEGVFKDLQKPTSVSRNETILELKENIERMVAFAKNPKEIGESEKIFQIRGNNVVNLLAQLIKKNPSPDDLCHVKAALLELADSLGERELMVTFPKDLISRRERYHETVLFPYAIRAFSTKLLEIESSRAAGATAMVFGRPAAQGGAAGGHLDASGPK